MRLSVGEKFGPSEALALVGKGGMGVIHPLLHECVHAGVRPAFL